MRYNEASDRATTWLDVVLRQQSTVLTIIPKTPNSTINVVMDEIH